jgi:hypothetical protein
MNNQQPTTPITSTPEQPTLPGIDPVTTGSGSDPVPSLDDLSSEIDRLKHDSHIRTAVYDIETRLRQSGARSPKLLAEQAKDQFQLSDEGELTNAEAVIEHLRKTYPEQFAPPSIDASAGRSARPKLTKEALARMTPAEIRRLDWQEVRSALQER